MTPVEYAGLLRDYGPWGIVAVLIGAVVYLHKGWQACQVDALRSVERLVTALEASKDAMERVEGALQGLRVTLDTRGQAVTDLARQVELVGLKVDHGHGNTSSALAGLLSAVNRERGPS